MNGWIVRCLFAATLAVLAMAPGATHAATLYDGALVERATSGGGFVASYTPQPNLPAAQASGVGWQAHGVVALTANDAWAVGSYMDSVGVEHAATEHFTGTWQNVANGAAPPYARLYSVDGKATNDVWAVGFHGVLVSGRRVARTLVEHWTGSAWSVVNSPDVASGGDYDFLVSVSADGPSDVWAMGATCTGSTNTCTSLFEHWNGVQWSIVPSTQPVQPGTTNAIINVSYAISALSSTDVWAAYGGSNGFVLHWNGTSWSRVSGAIPAGYEVNGIRAIDSTHVWAVGDSLAPQRNPTLFEYWDGTSWHIVSGPIPGHSTILLASVAGSGPDDVYAVGAYPTYVGNGTHTFAEHWNGSAWSIVGSQNPSTPDATSGVQDYLTSVSAVPGAAFAVGAQGPASG